MPLHAVCVIVRISLMSCTTYVCLFTCFPVTNPATSGVLPPDLERLLAVWSHLLLPAVLRLCYLKLLACPSVPVVRDRCHARWLGDFWNVCPGITYTGVTIVGDGVTPVLLGRHSVRVLHAAACPGVTAVGLQVLGGRHRCYGVGFTGVRLPECWGLRHWLHAQVLH